MNLKEKPDAIRIDHEDEKAAHSIAAGLTSLLPTDSGRPVLLVCIGTDRSTGDSLGPLIGTFLKEAGLKRFHVIGTLDDPVHAVNMQKRLDEIKESYCNPFIIGVDACLGRLKNIGVIQIGDGPVKPGTGVNKELPEVGDIHMTGIVNVSGFMELFVLQNTRLSLVMKMAKIAADGIRQSELAWLRRTAIVADLAAGNDRATLEEA